MPQISRDRGSYANGEVVRIFGSFQTNAATAPTVLRDGRAALFSVVRVSAALYEITLNTGADAYPIPERLIVEPRVWGAPAASPSVIGKWDYVAGSYNSTTRKFRIQFTKIGVLTAPTALALSIVTDADTGERVSFEIVGSINSAGTDVA